MRFPRREIAAATLLLCVITAFAEGGKGNKPSKSSPTSSSEKTPLASFFSKLGQEGQNDFIRPRIAPFLALEPNAPARSYVVDNLEKQSNKSPEKICNLVLAKDASGGVGSPMCAVLIDGFTSDTGTEGYYFKFALDGKLLSAIKTTTRKVNGTVVRGSGVKEDLDINSPDVQARFKKELDFWLSGKFRKYWKPKAAPKTAPN